MLRKQKNILFLEQINPNYKWNEDSIYRNYTIKIYCILVIITYTNNHVISSWLKCLTMICVYEFDISINFWILLFRLFFTEI